jgi:hypothetical protein
LQKKSLAPLCELFEGHPVPIVECPDQPLPFASWRTTLAPIFHGRCGDESDPSQWDEEKFVERLRRLFAEVLPEAPPIGFNCVAAQNASGEYTVTLTWQKDAEATFTGSGKTENIAFLDAAAKAYAHPHFRKLLDLYPTPHHDSLQRS